MTRVIIAEGCREVDHAGRRYYARNYRQGGSFDMPDAAAKQAVRIGGAIASLAGTTRRAAGWRCPACGFGSFVRRCSRCGTECERE